MLYKNKFQSDYKPWKYDKLIVNEFYALEKGKYKKKCNLSNKFLNPEILYLKNTNKAVISFYDKFANSKKTIKLIEDCKDHLIHFYNIDKIHYTRKNLAQYDNLIVGLINNIKFFINNENILNKNGKEKLKYFQDKFEHLALSQDINKENKIISEFKFNDFNFKPKENKEIIKKKIAFINSDIKKFNTIIDNKILDAENIFIKLSTITISSRAKFSNFKTLIISLIITLIFFFVLILTYAFNNYLSYLKKQIINNK